MDAQLPRALSLMRGSVPAPVNVNGHHVTFRFGEFELDSAAFELRRKGRRIKLSSQPMDVLMMLLERPGQLVPREEIRKRLWGDEVFVDVDAGIRTAVLRIRRALHDSRGTRRYLETVTGRGYRFIAPVAIGPAAAHSSRPPAALLLLSPDARRHNLPADLTSVVGRDRELSELRRLLGATRLLSLTGPGGVGKTRLATRLMSDLVSDMPGGIWVIDLAPLTSLDQMVQAAAALLRIRESPHRPLREALTDFVRDRELILGLDTAEHLLESVAELAEGLLREARGLRIVATSREALRLPGEGRTDADARVGRRDCDPARGIRLDETRPVDDRLNVDSRPQITTGGPGSPGAI